MKANNYKIVVLSELKDDNHECLISAIRLSKLMNGTVVLFQVGKPSEIINQESQLSAIRTLNHVFSATDKKIGQKIGTLSKEHNVNIDHSFAVGNIKNEIREFLKEQQPDMVMLGKRTPKPFSMFGDNLTNFVLKNYDGPVLITQENLPMHLDRHLSLGILNDITEVKEQPFVGELLKISEKPLKLFKLANSLPIKTSTGPNIGKKVITYTFEKSDRSLSNLSAYISKCNIDLLCTNRQDILSNKNFMNNLNTSVLLGGNRTYLTSRSFSA